MLRLLGHHNSSWYRQTRSRETMEDRIVARWDPRVTLLLMLQGDDFYRLIQNRGKMARNREFFARALIGEPNLIFRSRIIDREKVRIAPADAFHARVRELLELAHKRIEGDCQRDLMRPDLFALSRWSGFHSHIDYQSSNMGKLVGVRKFASNITEQALRIAAVLQFFDTGKLVIDVGHMQAGIDIAHYFLDEHLRLFQVWTGRLKPDWEILLNHLNRWQRLHRDTVWWPLKKIESCAPGKLRGQNRRTRIALDWLVENDYLLKGYPPDTKGLHFCLKTHPAVSVMTFQPTQLPQPPPMTTTTPPTV